MAEELEMLEGLVKDFDAFKTKSKKDLDAAVAAVKEASTAEYAEKLKEAKAAADEVSKKLDQINSDLAAKGATVEQMQTELKEFKAAKGRRLMGVDGEEESTISLLKQGFAENFEKIKEQSGEPDAQFKFKIKTVGTMTAAANLTGNVQATYATAPALRGRQKLQFRDLVRVISSSTGLWKFYRQNTPVGEGSVDFQTSHGAAKNQIDYDFTEVNVTVDYLAGFVRIAKQMLQDLPFMQTFVSDELVEDYLRVETSKFFGQLVSAATGTVPSGTVTIEKIIDAIANLEENDYSANGIVVTNPVWAKILKTKPNDYSLPGGSAAITIAANGDLSVVGIPVFRTKESNIGVGRFIVGDWTKAAIIQTEGLNVNMYEQDSDNVQRNLITIKAEARVALAILRTDAFIYGSQGTT